jgi:hypothetical protein
MGNLGEILDDNVRYKVTIEVDQQWLNILSQISKHQEGFVWLKIKELFPNDDLANYLIKRSKGE